VLFSSKGCTCAAPGQCNDEGPSTSDVGVSQVSNTTGRSPRVGVDQWSSTKLLRLVSFLPSSRLTLPAAFESALSTGKEAYAHALRNFVTS
jgi:hypothetical protein